MSYKKQHTVLGTSPFEENKTVRKNKLPYYQCSHVRVPYKAYRHIKLYPPKSHNILLKFPQN